MVYIKSIVIAIVTLALCIVYVLIVKKTKKIDKNKAMLTLLGVIIEILLGIAFNYFFGDFPIPPKQPETEITEISDDPEQDIKIEIVNNNYNYNSNGTPLTTTAFSEVEDQNAANVVTVQNIVQETSIPTILLTFKEVNNTLTDKNGIFKASTSVKAEKVTLYCEVNGLPYDEFEMKTSNLQDWTFDACFFEPNTYVLTAVAKGSFGEIRSDPITVKYPFQTKDN